MSIASSNDIFIADWCSTAMQSATDIAIIRPSVRSSVSLSLFMNKSSAVAEMGDRGHNRHGPKRGRGAAVPISGSWDPI